MPTRRGRTLIAAGALLYVVALFTSIDELFALALAAVLFPVCSVLFVRWGRHRLGFRRSVAPKRVFAGGSIKVEIGVHNLSRVPSPPLYLEDDAAAMLGGPLRFAVPSLAGEEREAVAVERPVSMRGRYALGPLRARLVDPFGLAEVSHAVAERSSFIVYPAIEGLAEGSPPEERTGGGRSLVQRLAAGGDDFYAVRDWADGDDLRMIHWRSTARRNELMIRQDEVRPFPRATVFVDTRGASHSGDGPASSLEWSISASASMTWELARQGFAMRLATAEAGPGGARWGREATDPLLTTLALATPSPARTVLPVLRRLAARPGAGGVLFTVMPPPEAAALKALTRLRRAYSWGGVVLVDTASFATVSARDRAAFDQRLAEAERMLARSGWRVLVAGSNDRMAKVWRTLLALGASHPSSRSLRS